MQNAQLLHDSLLLLVPTCSIYNASVHFAVAVNSCQQLMSTSTVDINNTHLKEPFMVNVDAIRLASFQK